MPPRRKGLKTYCEYDLRKDSTNRVSSRPVLLEDDIGKLTHLFEDAYGWSPRTFQISGIQAQLEGVDTILQAPTGAGKTAIVAGAHLWPQDEHKVMLMVSPLLSLEDEMVRTKVNDMWCTNTDHWAGLELQESVRP